MQFLLFIQRHFLRGVAALALASLTVLLAGINAGGWHDRGLDPLATLALITEALAFVMAVCVEGAGNKAKALVCAMILVGCELFNAAGSHQAWGSFEAPRLEAQQNAAQSSLDASRTALLQTVADAQARILLVPRPDQDTFGSRQAEQREFWETATADDRATKSRAQAQLDALPVVAAEPPPVFADWMVWGFLAFIGFAKSLGLWAIGMRVARNEEEVGVVAPVGDTVVEFDASAAARRLVAMRRDRRKQEA